MTYGDFKGLTRRKDYEKVLRDKGFEIAKYYRYQRGFAALFMNFLIKRCLLHT